MASKMEASNVSCRELVMSSPGLKVWLQLVMHTGMTFYLRDSMDNRADRSR